MAGLIPVGWACGPGTRPRGARVPGQDARC